MGRGHDTGLGLSYGHDTTDAAAEGDVYRRMATELKARERTFVADMQRKCELHEHRVNVGRERGDDRDDCTPIFDRRQTRRCLVVDSGGGARAGGNGDGGSGGGPGRRIPVQEEPSGSGSGGESDDASCGFDPLSPATFSRRDQTSRPGYPAPMYAPMSPADFDPTPGGLLLHPNPQPHTPYENVSRGASADGGERGDNRGRSGVDNGRVSPLGVDYVSHIEQAEKSFWGRNGYYTRQCLKPSGFLANRKGACE